MKYLYEQIGKKDGVVLRGVINTPDDFDMSKKYPTVIFYHGFGGDRNGTTWFRTMNAEYLAARGYVSVRFDFSGTNESDGNFYDMTVSREEAEAKMIYDFTRLRQFVDKDRIYVVGHSLGGVIATTTAAETKPRAICLLAPASDMNNPDYLKVMMASIDDKSDKKMTKAELLEKIKHTADADIGGVKLHKDFVKDFLPKDIYGAARKYRGPVLIMRGTADDLVFNDSNEKLQAAYPHAEYIQIEGADHSFKNEEHRMDIFKKMYDFFEANK